MASGDSGADVPLGEVGPGINQTVEDKQINELGLVSELGDPTTSRRRVPIERYVEWRVDQLDTNFRRAVSAWRKRANKIERLLSDSDDKLTLKRERDSLAKCMEDVIDCHDRYETLPPSQRQNDVFLRYEGIEIENHRLNKIISKPIREIDGIFCVDTESVGTSKSTKSKLSKVSKQSSASKRLEFAADAAALKARLECLDLVAQKRVEFEQKRTELLKAQTMEELNIAEAKLGVVNETATTPDIRTSLPRERLSTEENVRHFLLSSEMKSSNNSQDERSRTPIHERESGVYRNPIISNPHINSISEPLINEPPLSNYMQFPTQTEQHIKFNPLVKPFEPNVNANDFVPQTFHNVNSEPRNDQLRDVINLLSDQVSMSRLPAPEPSIFTGDPLKYPLWKSSFDILIGHKGIPSRERIFYLKRYLGGAAREAVEGYFLISSGDAYEEALLLLEQRFGNPFIIASSFRDKLESWPKIPNRDGQALRKFADFLCQCYTAMMTIQSLRCLDDERENQKLLGKLPDWLGLRWSRLVFDHREKTGVFPVFQEFVQFINKEANLACDPISSIQLSKPKQFESHKGGRFSGPERMRNQTVNSFITDTTTQSKYSHQSCSLCHKTHHIDECKVFLAKSIYDRKQYAREKGLCFACLDGGHRSKWCRQRKICNICSHKHPSSLHGDRPETLNVDPHKSKENLNSEHQYDPHNNCKSTSVFTTGFNANMGYSEIVSKSSMIVPVYISHISNPSREIMVYALLDTQSDTTFILDDLCQELDVSGPSVKLKLSTMTSSCHTVESFKINGLSVRGCDNDVQIKLPPTYTRDIMPANRSHIPTPQIAEKWPHLCHIAPKLSPLLDIPVALLIGYNCSRVLAPRDVIPPVGNEPYAQRTDLGWGVVGIVDHSSTDTDLTDNIGVSHRVLSYGVDNSLKTQSTASLVFRSNVKELINPSDVTRMMEMDFSDLNSSRLALSQNDRKFLSIISSGIHLREDGHYEMPLPFKDGQVRLPQSKPLAFHRLQMLKRRFISNPSYHTDYVSFMQGLIDEGLAEEVQNENNCESGNTWYIPHHGVYHPKKPSKIRVVFDCSAKCHGVSLNDQLLQGPDLTNGLQGILCRFRVEHVAFMCDIKQMFYQFKVVEEHRSFLRFLWWSGGDYTGPVKEYQMNVHIFGAVSSPGCANFGLKQTATDNEGRYGVDAANFIRRDFYVDDGLKSTSTVEEAVKLISDSKGLCSSSGLTLHKFVSNSCEVVESVCEKYRAPEIKRSDLFFDELSIERALGVQWAIEADTFCFRIVLKDQPLTRRGILSTVSSVYDPLGFVSPVILLGKQILQRMCADKADWDDPVSESIRSQWEKWRGGLTYLSKLEVNRCFKPTGFGNVKVAQVHHFSDASNSGYGQCSYIRLVDENNSVHCSLVMSKSRVTPLKPVTVPRLELTAAVVSVTISCFLREELYIDCAYLKNVTEVFWTDSKVVLGYISNESKRFHVFVANRVQQIREHTNLSQWKHVKTDQNPADRCSRGSTSENLVKSSWTTGPAFLWDVDLELTEDGSFEVCTNDPEVKSTTFVNVQTDLVSSVSLIDGITKFSSWYKAVRAIANCIRYKILLWKLSKLKNKATTRSSSNIKPICEPLTVDILKQAETEIIRIVQAVHFQKELKVLTSLENSESKGDNKCLRKSNKTVGAVSPLNRLDPFVDQQGVLRVGGRLKCSTFTDNLKHPVILPRKHHITKLLINDFHDRVGHQGRGMTVNAIREGGFWILGCSSAVSEFIHRCVLCRKMRRPLQEQKMADLPSDRLDPTPPFTYCAADIFGPWLIRDGRRVCKRYGALFTCMVSRAIHLETTNSLSTDSFINVLRRFIAIRGPVRQIRSDRGTNFVGAERELREAIAEMDQTNVKEFLLRQNCDYVQFRMNVPSASHMGGIWERQIRTVRNVLVCLMRAVGEQLDDESLRTFMCEAAAIVNSRPLTVNNLNDPMSLEPLTPSHILTMKSKVVLPPPGAFQRADAYCAKRWRRVQYMLNEFWDRWKREYLQNLQVRQKWNKSRRNFEVGDVVLVKDISLPRNNWPLAIVDKVNVNSDGHVRTVKLIVGDSTLDKSGKRLRPMTCLERPIQKLVLLLPNDNKF